MNYRFAKLDDCKRLGELNHQLIRDEGHRNPMNVKQLADRMSGWLSGEYKAVLFEEAGQLLAYALFREQPDEVYLRQLFVLPPHRSQGIGSRAVDALRTEIWPANKRLTVEVLVANTRAVKFWRSVGYQDYALCLEMMPGTASPGTA